MIASMVRRSASLLAIFICASCGRPRAAPPDPTDADRAAYDRYRQPDALVAALGLRVGARVADVGAGRGYLTFRLADAVGPAGRVVATDVDGDALAALYVRARAESRTTVSIRKES